MMMTSLTTITPFESPFQSRNPSTTNLNTISTNTSEISFINITPDEIINSINYCNDSDDGSIHKSKSNDLEIKLVEPIVFFRDVPEEAREVFSHNWKFITANKSPPTSSTSSLNSPSLNKFNFLKFNKKFHGDSSNDNNKTLLEDQEDGDVGNVTYQQIMDVNLPVCSEPVHYSCSTSLINVSHDLKFSFAITLPQDPPKNAELKLNIPITLLSCKAIDDFIALPNYEDNDFYCPCNPAYQRTATIALNASISGDL
ncbi:11649_t:CDS:2 [Entrophospora sp. SA101]|nr:11649_t:CDS:2 [Entrophospora sp. SA101]